VDKPVKIHRKTWQACDTPSRPLGQRFPGAVFMAFDALHRLSRFFHQTTPAGFKITRALIWAVPLTLAGC
jgi:hypothetical protein